MSGYLGQTPGQGQIQYFTFLATAGQTTFSGIDSNSYVLNYSVGFCDVFLNGRRLTPTSDYTALDGSTIVLQSAASLNDVVFVASASTFDTADWVTNSVNYVYVATAGQTSFTGADSNSNILTYVNGTILVSVNGLQLPQSDYTATNGSTVILNSGVNAGDIVQIFSLRTMNPVNIFTQTQSDARYLQLTGGTVSGNITVGNSTVNTQITAGNIALNGSTLLIGNSTSNVVITGTTLTISNSTSNTSFGTGPASINAISSNTFTIGTAAYVIANGNVGIGTSSPGSYKIAAVQNGGRAFFRFDNSNASSYSTSLGLGDTTAKGWAFITDYYANTGDNLAIYQGSSTTPRIFIDSNGNTGIGTTNPQYGRLQVSGKIYASDTIQSGNSFILQGNGMVTTNSSNNLLFGINEVEKARFDTSGRLLIGLTAPYGSSGERLTVNGMVTVVSSGTSSGNAPLYVYNTDTTASNNQPFINFHDGSSIRGQLGCNYTDGAMWINGAFGIRFRHNSGEVARFDSGTLAINTTTPNTAKKLHIFASGSVSETPQLLLEGGTNGYGAGITFQSRTSAGGTLVEMARVVADGDSSWNTTASTQDARLSFWTTQDGTAYERMRITSSGYLSVNNGITFPDGVTQTVAAGYPTYTLYTSYSVNTWYQAPVNLVVTVSMRGSYMNGLTVYAGINTSTYYNISEFGDDINSNTKSSGMTFLIKKGSYFYFGSPTPYSYAFENLWLYSFALS